MLIQIPRGCFAPDAGGEGGGDNPDKPTASSLLERYGSDALKMAERLAAAQDDAYKLREKQRELKAELEGLRGKVAPEGSAILTADDAKRWEAYTALGKPEDLTKAVSERDAAQAELSKVTRGLALHAAADAHGYKVAVLGKLPSLTDKPIEVREIEVEGQKVKRAFVKDGTQETGLAEYITAHDPELLPALTADAADTRKTGGTPYPAQPGNGGKPAVTNAAQTHIQKTKYAIPGRKEA